MQREKGNTIQIKFYSLLSHAPFVRRHVGAIRENIQKLTPSETAKSLTEDIGIHVFPRYDNRALTVDVLQNKPVLVVGNHPNYTEPLYVVAALPPRPDFSAIAFSGIRKILGKPFDPYLLPVFANHPRSDEEKRRQRLDNGQSLQAAGERIDKGHAVIMMPDGGSKKERWHPGVARLLKSVTNPDASLVMTYTPDAALTDLAYAFPFVRRGKNLSREVFIANPVSLKQLKEHIDFSQDDKAIALDLEIFYKLWARSVNQLAYKAI